MAEEQEVLTAEEQEEARRAVRATSWVKGYWAVLLSRASGVMPEEAPLWVRRADWSAATADLLMRYDRPDMGDVVEYLRAQAADAEGGGDA